MYCRNHQAKEAIISPLRPGKIEQATLYQINYRQMPFAPRFIALLALAVITTTLRADPTTQPLPDPLLYPPPPCFTDKVASTPHFFQRDPRWNLTVAGEYFCVPTAVSNSMVYFATHGYDRLLPEQDDPELAQIEIIRKLASEKYMNTNPDTGTGPSGALTGIRRYVEEHGYNCRLLQYAGWRPLKHSLRYEAVGTQPNLDWIKSAVANPNGAAWLQIGYFNHADSPNQWKLMGGHCMAVIGYGTDGTRNDPNLFLVDNSGIGKKVVLGRGPDGWLTRDLTPADQAISLTSTGPITVISMQGTRYQLPDLYRVTGPGIETKKYDAMFLDGAIVMVIGN
jgi:hypothetical protein